MALVVPSIIFFTLKYKINDKLLYSIIFNLPFAESD